MNKKGTLDYPIITVIFILIALLFLAPIMLKIVTEVTTPFANSLNNVSAGSGDVVTSISNTFVTFWDKVIMIAFLINLVLLILSAFLIRTHPFFIVLYIALSIFTMIFAPTIIDVVDKLYDSAQFVGETASLPMLDFLRNYFGIVILGIMIITGIIIYARFKGGQPIR